MLERLICFCVRGPTAWDSGWAAHAQRRWPGRMNVGASHIFFALEADCIQAGLNTRSARPHECWSLIFLR
jgi:hypothetical protein